MVSDENLMYLEKSIEIRVKVYEIYAISIRSDLIMVYEWNEGKNYTYTFEEFKRSLNQRSKSILEDQYKEAREENKTVLFRRDEIKRKFKSFTI